MALKANVINPNAALMGVLSGNVSVGGNLTVTGTTTFNGGGLWWKIGLGKSYRINNSGQVLQIEDCDGGGGLPGLP